MTLIFNLGDPLIVGGADHPAASYGSFVAGRLDAYAVTEFQGASRGLQLDMTPWGAHAFLGVPMHELATVVVPTEDLLGRFGVELTERLADAGGWQERFDLLDHAIAARTRGAGPSPDVAYAWERLRRSRGSVAIGELTSALGCSSRHLNSRFREQIGVPPKTAARVLRFRRSVDLLGRDDGRRFAEIALDCGYYDQAHLNREFRELAGTTPGSFLAARLPTGLGTGAEPNVNFVQDGVAMAA